MSMSLRNYCCNDDKTAHTTNNFNGATYITKYAPGKQYMNYQISNVAKNTQNSFAIQEPQFFSELVFISKEGQIFNKR